MIRDIRNQLIELARLRTTWSYSQLNDQLELGLNFSNPLNRDLIGDWLGEVSMHEYERGRPLLSSLITHQTGSVNKEMVFINSAPDYLVAIGKP